MAKSNPKRAAKSAPKTDGRPRRDPVDVGKPTSIRLTGRLKKLVHRACAEVDENRQEFIITATEERVQRVLGPAAAR